MEGYDRVKTVKTPLESFDQVVLTMFKEAVKNRDPNRDSLMLTVTNAIQMTLYRPKMDTLLAKSLIEDQIELQLDRMFRIIVESNDFELFKSAVHFLTVTVSHNVSMLAGMIEDSMWQTIMSAPTYMTDPQIKKEIERIRFTLKYSGREFTRILQLDESIDQLRSKTIGNHGKSDQEHRDVLELYANTLLLRLSFMISVGLLFQLRQGRLERNALTTYLTELWHHTTPEDADAVIVNVPPVPTDPLWLTLLYLYGGVNSGIWVDRYNFEDFHGTTKYVIQSYLLLLAKTAGPIPTPSDSEIGTYAQLELWDELGELHELARDFLWKTKSDDFTEELTALKTLRVDDFVMRNRLSRPDRTWCDDLAVTVEDARKRFMHVEQLILMHLPIDSEKVDEFTSQIGAAYKEESDLENLAVLTRCETDQLSSLKSFNVKFTASKDSFIKNSNVYGDWREMGRSIAWAEKMHAYEEASKNRTPSFVFETYNPDQILNAVTQEVGNLVAAETKPSLAFVPLPLFTEWTMRHINSISYDKGRILRLPQASLHLILSWRGFSFQDIVILDGTRCQWLYEEFSGSRVKCSVAQTASQLDKVEVDAQSRGLFVPGPDGIGVIKLLNLPKL